jgi:hypothetical protein
LVLAGSRFTKPAESRYAPIEGEALGVAYGLQQCRKFVLGCPDLVVAVDHKPLTRILNDRPLESIENPRLLRIKEKTMMFDFDIIHIPGESNMAADATSRYPTRSCPVRHPIAWEEDDDMTEEVEEFTRSYAMRQAESLPGTITWEMVKQESILDEECSRLRDLITQGFPKSRNDVPESLRHYYPMRDDLYIIDDVIFKGRKMLIPSKLRAATLEGLHASHQGIISIKANARDRLLWPGLDDLKRSRDQCRHCNENAPSQPDEPLMITPPPDLPFQQVATDFYQEGGQHYIIYADRFTGWTEVEEVPSTSFRDLQKRIVPWFRTYGVPEEISSDGGPPFKSDEFQRFLRKWGIKHRLSSAYYPKSNGRAEAAVKSMKRALRGNTDPRTGAVNTDAAVKAMMNHRNTPNQETGISPAEMLFGCKLRDHLPNQFRTIRKEWNDIQSAKELLFSQKDSKLSTSGKVLKTLQVGDTVSVQNQHGNRPGRWNNTGVIVEVRPNRQYGVMLDGSRRITLRNRKFLRKLGTRQNRLTHANKYDLPTSPVDTLTPVSILEGTSSTPKRMEKAQVTQHIPQLSPIPSEGSPIPQRPVGSEVLSIHNTPQQRSPTPQHQSQPAGPRRTTRPSTKPKRLIEEM